MIPVVSDVRRMVPLVVITTMLLLFALMTSSMMLGLLIPVAFVGLLAVIRPTMGLFSGLLLIVLVPSVESVYPSAVIKMVEQGCVLGLVAICLVRVVMGEDRIRLGPPVDVALALLFTLVGASAVANQVPMKYVIFFLMVFFKPFALLYLSAAWLRPRHTRLFVRVFVLIIVLQMLFNLAFLAGINPLPYLQGRRSVDVAVGTVGASHDVAYLMMMGIFMLVAGLSRMPSFGQSLQIVAGIVLLMIQFVTTYAIHAYVFLLAGCALIFILFFQRKALAMIRLGIPLLALAVTLWLLFILSPEKSITGELLDVDRMQRRIENTVGGPKGRMYQHVFMKSADYMPYPIVGAGPGNYTSNIAFLHNRPMTQLGHVVQIRAMLYEGSIFTGSILSDIHTGYLVLFGELGPIGFIVYWFIFVYAGLRVWRQIRNNDYGDPLRLRLAQAFVATMAVVIVANSLIESISAAHLTWVTWVWAGLIWYPDSHFEPEDMESEGAHV